MKRILIVITVLVLSCGKKDTENKTISVFGQMELNDSAFYLIQNHSGNPESLQKAVIILDKVISENAENSGAVNNKISAQIKLNDFEGAINTIDNTLENTKTNAASLVQFKGLLYRKTGNDDSAVYNYEMARELYHDILQHSTDSLKRSFAIVNIASLTIFLGEREKGLAILDSAIISNPADSTLVFHREWMTDSSEEDFLENVFQ